MPKKGYTKKTSRSRRKSPAELKARISLKEEGQVQLSLPLPHLLAAAHGAVESLAGEVGLLVIKALIEDEVEQLAGARYVHDQDRLASRWGKEEGYVVFGGRKVPIERPRVRQQGGKEIPLQRYQIFQQERMENSIAGRILRGVSTRNYAGVLDDFCDGYGIEKSSVSRQWKAATVKELGNLLERPLHDLDLAVIMVDGISFHDSLLVVAIGVAFDGTKQILGIWDGATENSAVVTALLENLVERGLKTTRRLLFVIDGSKALKKGIVTVFGKSAIIQRCQIHKMRNVISHLPETHHTTIQRELHAAWGMTSFKEAYKALQKTLTRVERLSPGAAASLREGLEETLTLHKLEVPEKLRKGLRTTNTIESIFARNRELCKNVKRWRNAEMALRWASTMLLHAEKKFRRVNGHRHMPELVRALDHVDNVEAVA